MEIKLKSMLLAIFLVLVLDFFMGVMHKSKQKPSNDEARNS